MDPVDAAPVTQDVIVVGGGFAGVATAQRLARKGVRVLLIDKNNYHQFQPLLYQVATAQIGTSEVARPLRAIFRRHRHVRVVIDTVTAVDPVAKKVTLSDGTVCRATVLVLALGSEANFFGIDGAREHSFPLYSLRDAVRLGARMVADLDDADSPAGMKRSLDLIVIGGGPTGVELAGAVAENVHTAIAAAYSAEFARNIGVRLLDMGTSVLRPFSEKSQAYAHQQLQQMGVELRLGVQVTQVRSDGVTLGDGTEVPGNVVVWAGGLKAPQLISDSGLPQGRGGRVDVDPDLTVPGFEGVYVLGDCANISDRTGRPLPQLGSVALQSGRWAARNILADLAGRPRSPFRYLDKGIMAMIGRGAAVAEIGPRRLQVQGPLAFLSWLGVHAALLSGVWQRLGAAASWAVDYLTPARPQVVLGHVDRAEPPAGH
ncbi:NAD(P)/FAD-dependent oxidoreductase [Mycolicibacillus parakoreensis]|uniref:NAD(P)/FAD-dependent oxidoreductase n=1 Tax=Mycolicibacillus parakoreensis TaxID=1069221 RepID=A0ABY3U851_9MYCO|nr:NAD(P)/FAD-dependent oxidoreductase [Mycolicibacillus parakoreensis]MCV7317452.1 NAD(P)/FAD-dependent oxidoreductase [Mycolicibacillus parakoreensis]ULN53927.1 NAD(P)/FAD-dependent oxidoreductase [Mycolicibacillus parakoreensis]